MSPEAASRLRRAGDAFGAYWPALLALAFFALLPLRRQMEIPLSLFALAFAVLAFNAARRTQLRAAAGFIIPLFLCIWIPMLASCLDSLDPDKSWLQTLSALRYPAAALAIAVVMREDKLRHALLRLMTWLLLFWAADGYVQLAFGFDLFGVPMHEDRLNALFYSRYQYYGPTLALLSPLAIDYMRHHWSKVALVAGFAFILGAVLISGMRSAWLIMLVVTATFMVPMLRDRATRRQALLLPAAGVVTLAIVTATSPLLQERMQLSSLAVLGTEAALDEASSYRVPIFRHALAMYRDHPVNGVGVRAFGEAYPRYAAPDDPHIRADGGRNRAHQAHNIVLEFMADTGSIGLAGLITALFLALRHWRALDPRGRKAAFPFAVSLLAVVFPLNSWFAFFGVYTSSVTWVLVGLMAAAPVVSGDTKQRAQVGDGHDGHRNDEENSDDVLGHGPKRG